jgi:hypothetical protein
MFRQVNNLVSKYKQDGHLVFLNVLHVYMFVDVWRLIDTNDCLMFTTEQHHQKWNLFKFINFILLIRS